MQDELLIISPQQMDYMRFAMHCSNAEILASESNNINALNATLASWSHRKICLDKNQVIKSYKNV